MKPLRTVLASLTLAWAALGCAYGQQCANSDPLGDIRARPAWNGWGVDLRNTRFQPAKDAGLTPEQVSGLKLKWAFGVPEAKAIIGQPTVAGGRVFISGDTPVEIGSTAAFGCRSLCAGIGAS